MLILFILMRLFNIIGDCYRVDAWHVVHARLYENYPNVINPIHTMPFMWADKVWCDNRLRVINAALKEFHQWIPL